MIVFGDLAMSCERDPGVQIIRLLGELDGSNAGGLQLELHRILTRDADAIVIDLADLASIDSTGARLILSAHARSRDNASGLTVRRASAAVRRALEIAGDDVPFFAD